MFLRFAKYNSVESGSGVFFIVSIFCFHKYKSGSFTFARKQGKTKKTNKGNKDTNGISFLQSWFTNTQSIQIQNHKTHKYKSSKNLILNISLNKRFKRIEPEAYQGLSPQQKGTCDKIDSSLI